MIKIRDYLTFTNFIVFCFAVAVLDEILPYFMDVSLLRDSSIIATLLGLWYLFWALIIMGGIILQRLVYADMNAIFGLIFQYFMVLSVYLLDATATFLFDLIGMPFRFVGQLAALAGFPMEYGTTWEIAGNNQYWNFDLATFTFRLGLAGDIFENGAHTWFQFSMFGVEAFDPPNTEYSFCSLGFFGFSAVLDVEALGQSLYIPNKTGFLFDLKWIFDNVFDALLKSFGTPEYLYNYYLSLLKF